MKRSLEATKPTSNPTETTPAPSQETPLFDALQLEYNYVGTGDDLEIIGSEHTPVIAAFSDISGDETSRKAYEDMLNTIPADSPESHIPIYLETFQHEARKLDPNFIRPAAIFKSNDKIFWNASTGAGTTGLAVVSSDSGERLGADVNAGVITDLPASHKLIIADNDLLQRLEMDNILNLGSIVNDEGDRMLYPLYGAIVIDGGNTNTTSNEVSTGADSLKAKEAAYASRKKDKLDKLGLPYDATPEEIKAAVAERKAQHRQTPRNAAEIKALEDELDMTKVFADDADLQAEIAAATATAAVVKPGRAAGFTDAQTAILDTMRGRRVTAGQLDMQHPQGVSPELERARNHLNSLRDEMAKVAAKRQGRLFSSKNNSHADLEAEYDETLAILGKMECDTLLNDTTKTESEKNVGVIAFIFDEQQKLREATAKRLKNTSVSTMIEWVNRGTKTQRLLKGAAIGAGSVLIGAGVGAIVGAAAGVGLAAAATVTATSVTRFGRYYAKEDSKQGRGMSILDATQSEKAKRDAIHSLEQNSSGDKFTLASQQFKELFDTDTKKEQEKRRKSARRAIGGVALGMLVGGAAAYAIGEVADGAIGEWSNRTIATPEAAAQPVEPTPEGSSSKDVDEIIPKQPEPIRTPEYSIHASTVTLGEGWYQTFSEVGITDPGQQYALLHNQALMQELANQGLAYPDATLGGWGINMTVDGKMPLESLKLIEDYAKQSGYSLAS